MLTPRKTPASLDSPKKRRSVSGHVHLMERKKGPVWYWRIRLPDGFTHDDGTPKREERKPIGPAWTGSGRTPDGYVTKRTAQRRLDERLADLRRGIGIPAVRSRATFRDAAEHWYVHRSAQQDWKPSTRRDIGRRSTDTSSPPSATTASRKSRWS